MEGPIKIGEPNIAALRERLTQQREALRALSAAEAAPSTTKDNGGRSALADALRAGQAAPVDADARAVFTAALAAQATEGRVPGLNSGSTGATRAGMRDTIHRGDPSPAGPIAPGGWNSRWQGFAWLVGGAALLVMLALILR